VSASFPLIPACALTQRRVIFHSLSFISVIFLLISSTMCVCVCVCVLVCVCIAVLQLVQCCLAVSVYCYSFIRRLYSFYVFQGC
jgi:hypothetical protein